MFKSIWNAAKQLFVGSTSLKAQYEEILLQEALVDEADVIAENERLKAEKAQAEAEAKAAAEAKAKARAEAEEKARAEFEAARKAAEAPKRARNAKGKLVGDDKSTPDVNEAWVGGKAPVSKAKAKGKKKKK